ncbi:MAG: nucleotidyltransferase family protein [Acidobacteria bacterium]|nr:nucleotidyltransferase family protein [Acidobacteriota bacterium]
MSADSESVGAASSPPNIAGLVLAAGESSRMGYDKALLTYKGRSFLETITFTLSEAGIRCVVAVLGHHAEYIKQNIKLAGVEVVVNQDYRLGQTSSLQAGLGALAKSELDGVILCLVDHPAISANTFKTLIQHFRRTEKPVMIPEFRGKHGHPVLIGLELFTEILALGPNEGADSVIRKYRDRTEFIEVPDPGILLDIDDPEAYRQLTAQK